MQIGNRHIGVAGAGRFLAGLVLFCLGHCLALAAGTPAGTVIANQATVVYEDDNGEQQAPIYANTLTFTVGQIAVINLSPASATKPARLGTAVDYASRVVNSGNGSDYFRLASRSSLDLRMATYHDVNSNGTLDAEEQAAGEIFAVGLAADGQISLVTRLVVPDSADLSGLVDRLTLTATSMFDTTRSASGVYTTEIGSAHLVATKSVDNPTPAASARVRYTIAIRNEGDADAAGITVVDLLNANLRYIPGSASPAPASAAGQTLQWEIEEVAAGAALEIVFDVEVAAGLAEGAEIHNSADVAWLDGKTRREKRSDESSFITVAATAGGRVTIGPEHVGRGEPGDTIVHRLTLRNNSAAAASFDLGAESTLGLAWTFHADRNASGTIDDGEDAITTTESLAAGGEQLLIARTILPLVEIDGTADSTTFRAVSKLDPLDAAHSGSRSVIGIPVMTLSKSTAQPVQRSGGEITYTIGYANSGSGHALEFEIVDAIPASTIYVPGSIRVNMVAKTEADDDDGVVVGSGVLTVRLGTIPPASTGSIEFRVRIE